MAFSFFFAAIMLSLCSARQFDEPAPPPLPTAQLATPTMDVSSMDAGIVARHPSKISTPYTFFRGSAEYRQ
jgi:hypothetical protein